MMSQGKGLQTSEASVTASDRGLDVALAGLSRAVAQRVADDDAFARAVLQRVSESASVDPIDAADLDELLDAPLPDDFDAASRGPAADVGPAARAGDDRATSGPTTAAREPAMSTKHDPPPPSLRDPLASRPSQIEGLARLSMSGPPSVSRPAEEDRFGADSGLINLKALNEPEAEAPKETSFAAAAAAASAPVSAPSLDGSAAPASKRAVAEAAPASKRAAPSAAAAVAPPKPATGDSKTTPDAPVARSSRAPVPQPAAAAGPTEPKKKSGALIFATFGGVALMAAAAAVYVGVAHKSDSPAAAVAAKNESTTKVALAIAQTAASASARAETTTAVAAPAPSASDGEEVAKTDGKDLDERKKEAEAPAGSATAVGGAVVATRAGDEPAMVPSKAAKSKSAAGAQSDGDKVAAADTPAAPPPAAPTVAAAPPPAASAEGGKPSAKSGSLDDMLGLGAGGTAPTKPTAATPSGPELPDRPDRTDIQSAINSKLGRGAGCVKGLDGPTKVTVTFGPDGSVTGVSVISGPAKGTGAEACISTAFRSAKVPATKKGGSGNATLMP